jgi:hypothetical protein
VKDFDPSTVKVGDRIRVVLEGQIGIVDHARQLWVGPVGTRNIITPAADHVISIEKVARPTAVGDEINYADLRDLHWTRGTVIVDQDASDAVYTNVGGTTWAGCWHTGIGYTTSIGEMRDESPAGWKVVYLP